MAIAYKHRPGQIDFDAYRSQPGGAIMMTPEFEGRLSSANAAIDAETQRKLDSQRRMEKIFRSVSMAIPAAGAGMAAAGAGAPAFGIGAANTGAWTAPTVGSAATATSGAGGLMGRLGKIFSSTGFETAANAGLSLLGLRSQNKASDQARKDALANQTKMIELEQQRLAQELQNANLDREDARALNAAIQELEGKKFALAQESAQFDRENALFNRGVVEREQGAKDRYRSTISEPAAARMRSILGLG